MSTVPPEFRLSDDDRKLIETALTQHMRRDHGSMRENFIPTRLNGIDVMIHAKRWTNSRLIHYRIEQRAEDGTWTLLFSDQFALPKNEKPFDPDYGQLNELRKMIFKAALDELEKGKPQLGGFIVLNLTANVLGREVRVGVALDIKQWWFGVIIRDKAAYDALPEDCSRQEMRQAELYAERFKTVDCAWFEIERWADEDDAAKKLVDLRRAA